MNQSLLQIQGLREQIVDYIREDVFCGRLKEGARLSENELVNRFGVSRTPIREALVQLSHEGILESIPNRGVRVAMMPSNELQELVAPIRCTLESFALDLIYDQLNSDDFLYWDELLNKLKIACQNKDYVSTVESDLAFHRSIVKRTNQRDLEMIWLTIIARVRNQFLESHKSYDDLMVVYHDHKNIVDIFRSGDKQESIKGLVKDISP
jgi:DNA-binding GntR family transcriptional regulator